MVLAVIDSMASGWWWPAAVIVLSALAREGRSLGGESTAAGEGLRVSVQDVGRWWPLGTAPRAADADRPGGDAA